jgi:hypothetical protein
MNKIYINYLNKKFEIIDYQKDYFILKQKNYDQQKVSSDTHVYDLCIKVVKKYGFQLKLDI